MNLFKATIAVALNACALLGADFFPLQDGNTWTYREAVSGQTLSVRVGQPTTIGGNVYYKLTGYAGLGPSRSGRAGLRFVGVLGRSAQSGASTHVVRTFRRRLLVGAVPALPGAGWTDAGEARQSRRAGRSCVRCTGDPLPAQLDARMSDPCKSSMPSISVCCAAFRLRSRVPAPIDLVSARVGKTTIDAAPTGRFSVSVNPTAGPGPVSATFRLQVNSHRRSPCHSRRGRNTTSRSTTAPASALEVVRQPDVLTIAAPADGDRRMERYRRDPVAHGSGRRAPARRLHGTGDGHGGRIHSIRCDGAGYHPCEVTAFDRSVWRGQLHCSK